MLASAVAWDAGPLDWLEVSLLPLLLVLVLLLSGLVDALAGVVAVAVVSRGLIVAGKVIVAGAMDL
jgi:hypothetical protein